jgi:hypothetical protein
LSGNAGQLKGDIMKSEFIEWASVKTFSFKDAEESGFGKEFEENEDILKMINIPTPWRVGVFILDIEKMVDGFKAIEKKTSTKIPYGQKEFEGCKFFPLENVIECTYDLNFNVKKFFVDRVEVERPGLIEFLRSEYDNQQLFRDIVEYEFNNAGIKRRQKEALENPKQANPIFNRA